MLFALYKNNGAVHLRKELLQRNASSTGRAKRLVFDNKFRLVSPKYILFLHAEMKKTNRAGSLGLLPSALDFEWCEQSIE